MAAASSPPAADAPSPRLASGEARTEITTSNKGPWILAFTIFIIPFSWRDCVPVEGTVFEPL